MSILKTIWKLFVLNKPIHCDDLIGHKSTHPALENYLWVNRMPARMSRAWVDIHGEPKCFATYKGKRVRLVMASRLGDVGISYDLDRAHGYSDRVTVDKLSGFGNA